MCPAEGTCPRTHQPLDRNTSMRAVLQTIPHLQLGKLRRGQFASAELGNGRAGEQQSSRAPKMGQSRSSGHDAVKAKGAGALSYSMVSGHRWHIPGGEPACVRQGRNFTDSPPGPCHSWRSPASITPATSSGWRPPFRLTSL